MRPTAGDGDLLAGRYRLRSLLGRGGMAEVYDAFDERLARPVAVKVLLESMAGNPGMRQRFEREARSAARLSHPAVVAVYDSGEDRGRAFLVMERLPGETLADRMRAGPIDGRWLTTVAVAVLGALDAAHAQGLVHRDIKPANILLAGDGTAKVADFGIAKAYRDDGDPTDPQSRDLTATGMVLGTVAYLAPEQIDGEAASPQSDLYGLSVVLYEALAGRKPFLGDTPIAQARAAHEGLAPDITELRPDTPPALAAVIRRGMARRPGDRYVSAAAMRADLVGPAATTVMSRPDPGATSVMARPPAAADATRLDPRGTALGPPADRNRPQPPPPEHGDRRGLLMAVTVVAVLVVIAAIVAIILASRHHPSPSATSSSTSTTSPAVSSTTAGATTTTLPAEDQALESEAKAFDAEGGAGPMALAGLLEEVADAAPGNQAAVATQAEQTAATLLSSGSITAAEYQDAITDLESVPGVPPPATTTTATTSTTTSTTTTTTTTTVPATTTSDPGQGDGDGQGQGGG